MNSPHSHVAPRRPSLAGLALFAVTAAAIAGCGGEESPPSRQANLFNATALRAALEKGAADGATGAASEEAALAEPTGWSTIRGAFKLRGSRPNPGALTITRDADYCAAGGHTPMDETLVVSPNGGIRDVLVFLTTPIPDDSGEATAKYTHPSYNLTNNPQLGQVVFDQKQCVFLSHVFAARAGQSILIKNSDSIGHNTKLEPRSSSTFNETIPAGGSTPYVPDRQERDPFPVGCSIHQWMSAQMIFRDNPYFAVTDSEGAFEIANVPAGVKLDFRVWQEKLKNVTKVTYTVPGGSSSEQSWKKGVMPVTLTPDEPLVFEASIDASLIK